MKKDRAATEEKIYKAFWILKKKVLKASELMLSHKEAGVSKH
jgi:hypothetical protein